MSFFYGKLSSLSCGGTCCIIIIIIIIIIKGNSRWFKNYKQEKCKTLVVTPSLDGRHQQTVVHYIVICVCYIILHNY